MIREDGREQFELRKIEIVRNYTKYAQGSVLIAMGDTKVLCTASLDAQVPPWLAGQGRGWITAEYSMLPGSTAPRKRRERERLDGRSSEIQGTGEQTPFSETQLGEMLALARLGARRLSETQKAALGRLWPFDE